MSAKIYSPLNIQVLLHCYCSTQPYYENLQAPAVREAFAMLIEYQAIEPHPGYSPQSLVYRTTDLGKAWVQALCNVACPKIAYVDEHGNILE